MLDSVEFWEGIMPKAEYRSAIRSRKLIKEALADLLQEKPLEKITVTDVVNRAGINRGTFYAHYADIPDVIQHLIQQAFSSIQEVLVSQTSVLTDLPHALLTQIQQLLEDALSFFQNVMTSSAAALMQDQLVKIVVDYRLQNSEAFCTGNPEQYELSIRFCAGGISSLYRSWFAGALPYTLSKLTQTGEELLLRVINDVN